MGLERLREFSKETGVEELWRGEVSLEVKEAWARAQSALREEKKEGPLNAL